MKKVLFSMIIVMLFAVCLQPAFADDNIEGHIYSTDILTFVNGKPIDGYNIGGRTVVIAEDLTGYGFGVEYDDESRILRIISYFNHGFKDVEEIPRGKVGNILGNIYKTDISVYYNGILVKGHNIGGRTAICIEELGDTSDSPNADYGFSQYLGKSVWNPEKRTISYESYIKNESEILGISRVYHRFKDNIIYTYADDFCAVSEFLADEDNEFTGMYTYSAGIGMSKYSIKPLYFDNHGEFVKIGQSVLNPNNTQNEALIFIEDTESVKEMIKTFKNSRKSHDEAMEYFASESKIIEKIENDDYTVLMTHHETEGILFIYINKQGGFIVDRFFSAYSDREVKMWFDESGENSGPNTVVHSVYPFAGPHGTTTAQYATDMDEFDYE